MTTYIIAGPCAAESEQQVLATAEGISRCRDIHPNHIYIYRAGVWKPRTSPDSFQGIGSEGLPWLTRVQLLYKLPVATEVSTAAHVHEALSAGINYLWIGARTAANPIAVQTIADAIAEFVLHHPSCRIDGVFIKNPVNDDAALWLGNIARLEKTGVCVLAIHRGCNHKPCWKMAYQLVQQRPDIPLILDPSHLSGNAAMVEGLCLKVQRLTYQGWMIETHVNPTAALSDAKQQISPNELEAIVTKLGSSIDVPPTTELDWLRCMIDEEDDDLWCALAKRFEICRQIGRWKKKQGVAVVQPARYQEILQRRQEWGKQAQIDSEVVKQIMDVIHTESVRVQS